MSQNEQNRRFFAHLRYFAICSFTFRVQTSTGVEVRVLGCLFLWVSSLIDWLSHQGSATVASTFRLDKRIRWRFTLHNIAGALKVDQKVVVARLN